MEERFEKFRESKQAAVKLQIALEDYFREDLPQRMRDAYGTYLKMRIRPAAEQLIREEKLDKLDRLWTRGWIPLPLDSFLRLAAEEHKNAAFLWLLEKKQETGGFSPRDFSL